MAFGYALTQEELDALAAQQAIEDAAATAPVPPPEQAPPAQSIPILGSGGKDLTWDQTSGYGSVEASRAAYQPAASVPPPSPAPAQPQYVATDLGYDASYAAPPDQSSYGPSQTQGQTIQYQATPTQNVPPPASLSATVSYGGPGGETGYVPDSTQTQVLDPATGQERRYTVRPAPPISPQDYAYERSHFLPPSEMRGVRYPGRANSVRAANQVREGYRTTRGGSLSPWNTADTPWASRFPVGPGEYKEQIARGEVLPPEKGILRNSRGGDNPNALTDTLGRILGLDPTDPNRDMANQIALGLYDWAGDRIGEDPYSLYGPYTWMLRKLAPGAAKLALAPLAALALPGSALLQNSWAEAEDAVGPHGMGLRQAQSNFDPIQGEVIPTGLAAFQDTPVGKWAKGEVDRQQRAIDEGRARPGATNDLQAAQNNIEDFNQFMRDHHNEIRTAQNLVADSTAQTASSALDQNPELQQAARSAMRDPAPANLPVPAPPIAGNYRDLTVTYQPEDAAYPPYDRPTAAPQPAASAPAPLSRPGPSPWAPRPAATRPVPPQALPQGVTLDRTFALQPFEPSARGVAPTMTTGGPQPIRPAPTGERGFHPDVSQLWDGGIAHPDIAELWENDQAPGMTDQTINAVTTFINRARNGSVDAPTLDFLPPLMQALQAASAPATTSNSSDRPVTMGDTYLAADVVPPAGKPAIYATLPEGMTTATAGSGVTYVYRQGAPGDQASGMVDEHGRYVIFPENISAEDAAALEAAIRGRVLGTPAGASMASAPVAASPASSPPLATASPTPAVINPPVSSTASRNSGGVPSLPGGPGNAASSPPWSAASRGSNDGAVPDVSAADFLRDFNQNGEIDDADRARARTMAMAANRRKRAGKRGSPRATTVPSFPPSPLRDQILAAIGEAIPAARRGKG